MKKLVLGACFFTAATHAEDKIVTYTSKLLHDSVVLQIIPKNDPKPHAIIETTVLPGESVAVTVPGGAIGQLTIENGKGLKEVWLAYKKDPAHHIKRKKHIHVYYDRDQQLNSKASYAIKKMPVVGFTVD